MSDVINRMAEIKKKGFDMTSSVPSGDVYVNPDFSKIQVGVKKLEDAILDVGDYKKTNKRLGDKAEVLKAISDLNYPKLREISNFFYRTSGIYQRLCRYMAYFYRYDWMITPYKVDKKAKSEEMEKTFYEALKYLDDFHIKHFFGDVALKVVRNGVYYGYLIGDNTHAGVQELPPNYCRTRLTNIQGRPAVEFNMQYFDDKYTNEEIRNRVLGLFPPEFKKGYNLYKKGKLIPDFPGDTAGWYLLDIEKTIKFSLNGEDFPMFIAVIPAIIDLNEAQGLDRKKMQQQLLKIIIQKMPIDKNGELVFDVDEARELHNNVVQMLGKAIGIDVLTTFADVDVANMADNSTNSSIDQLEKIERAVYNEGGVSQLQFNADGNIALNNSILNDEAAMFNLITQFEEFLNVLLKPFNKKPKKYRISAQILTTTIYNFKEMSKLYKEQMQLGYSKMLAQIALGQSQSSILANADFENNVLNLVNVFIPPMSSSVMNADALQQVSGKGNENSQGGRPEKEDSDKSEKTIQNIESQS